MFSFELEFAVPPTCSGDLAEPAPAPESLPRQRILLAEDNEVNQTFLQLFLEDAGHEVVIASNGIQALEFLNQQPFDLVLMDVQMPEMDGVEATRRIRADHSGRFDPRIPIVALTAYSMKGDMERFLSVGMDAYVSKPVDMEELFQVLSVLVGRQERPPEGGVCS